MKGASRSGSRDPKPQTPNPKPVSAMARMTRLLGSAFGLGLLPKAPGTFGTLAGVALAWVLPSDLAVVACAVGLTVAALPLVRVAERESEDPGWFVLDEVAGYLVAVAFVPRSWTVLAAAFVLFRVFDIWKPWPVRAAERVRGGWGVMLDDLVAGLYANLVLQSGLLAWA